MSWLPFLSGRVTGKLLAELLNAKRLANVPHDPFTIQALETDPEYTKLVVIGKFPSTYAPPGTTVFDVTDVDPAWLHVIRLMGSEIEDKSPGCVFISCGYTAELVTPMIDSTRHIRVSLPVCSFETALQVYNLIRQDNVPTK